MALPGPDFHRRQGRGAGSGNQGSPLPFLCGRWRGRAARSPAPSPSPRCGRGGGSDPAPLPLLFNSASPPAEPSSGTPRGGGGRAPARRGTRGSSAAPPRAPTTVPRGGGGGCQAQTGPAPPAATREASRAPRRPLRGSGPRRRRPPPGHQARRRAGAAYRDVRDALLALVGHGPSGPSARPPASLSGAVARPHGAVTKPGGYRRRRAKLGARGCPAAARALLPAPRGSARGGRRRQGGRRGLQTDSSSCGGRRAGFAPLGSNQEALPFRPPPAPPAGARALAGPGPRSPEREGCFSGRV